MRDVKSKDAGLEKREAEAVPVEASRTRLEKCMLVACVIEMRVVMSELK